MPDPMLDALRDASPARRLRDAIEPIAMHSVWSKVTQERLALLGLDFLSSYVWGRAAALGEPQPGVVTSSFAVFEPTLVRSVYEAGRAACRRDEMLAARCESTIESLGAVLGEEDVATVARVADAMRAAVTGADGTGRPIFSGLRDQAWPEEPIGRLWRACELAREHRGDGHVAVCVAAGLGPIEMNILTELWLGMPLAGYTTTRGWSSEAIEAAAERLRNAGHMNETELTTAGRDFRHEIEVSTDRLDQEIVEALGTDAEIMIDQLDAWSAACVAAGAFPADVHKRAAG